MNAETTFAANPKTSYPYDCHNACEEFYRVIESTVNPRDMYNSKKDTSYVGRKRTENGEPFCSCTIKFDVKEKK